MENFDDTTETVCYGIINIGIILFAAAALFIVKRGVDLHQMIPGCFFYRLTGYYCPGCGGTRAVVALLKGHPLQSLRCHPFVGYGALIIGAFWMRRTLELITKRRLEIVRLKPLYLYTALGIVVLQWIVKNVLLYTQGVGIESVF